MRTVQCELSLKEYMSMVMPADTVEVSCVDDNYLMFLFIDSCLDNPKKYSTFLNFVKASDGMFLDDNPDFEADAFDEGYLDFTVYAYKHTDIALSLIPFGCTWDSYTAGIIRVPIKSAKGCIGFLGYGKSQFLPDNSNARGIIYKYVQEELETYSAYLNGYVYGVKIIDINTNFEEECYGIYLTGSNKQNKQELSRLVGDMGFAPETAESLVDALKPMYS